MSAALEEVRAHGRDAGALYHDFLTTQLSEAARKILEDTVAIKNYEWQSDFAKTHRAEGEAKGEAKSLLLFLQARGIDVPDDIRERIASCTDTDQLERWVQRAAVIDTADQLLD